MRRADERAAAKRIAECIEDNGHKYGNHKVSVTGIPSGSLESDRMVNEDAAIGKHIKSCRYKPETHQQKEQ